MACIEEKEELKNVGSWISADKTLKIRSIFIIFEISNCDNWHQIRRANYRKKLRTLNLGKDGMLTDLGRMEMAVTLKKHQVWIPNFSKWRRLNVITMKWILISILVLKIIITIINSDNYKNDNARLFEDYWWS